MEGGLGCSRWPEKLTFQEGNAVRKSILILAGFLVAAAFGSHAQEFAYDSPYVLELRREYLRQGKLFPHSSFPVTLKQLNDAAGQIGYTLAYESQADADGIRYLFFLDTLFDANLSYNAALIEPHAPRDGIDIQRSWYHRAPFLRAGASISGESGLMVALEFEGQKEWGGDWYNAWNLPEDGGEGHGLLFDNQILSRGVLSWQGKDQRLSLGRSPTHIGPAGVFGLYPSSRLPYLDAFRFDGRIGRLQIDWLLGGFHPIESWEAEQVGETFKYDVIKPEELWNGTNPIPIFFGIHRLQYLGERFRISVGEQIFFARNPVFYEVNDFLPIATWHGLDFYPDNMALILDFSWAFMRGFALHGMAGYDDISSDIFGIYDSPVPTIDAYVLALEFDLPVAGSPLSGLVQLGYTHYLWGNFDAAKTSNNQLGDKQLLLARHIARYYTDDGDGILLPFSSPYGPGALWFQGETAIKPFGEWLSLGFDFLFLSKNTQANLIDTDYERSDQVANAPRRVFLEFGFPLKALFRFFSNTVKLDLRPAMAWLDGGISLSLDLLVGMGFGGGDGALKRY